MALTNPKLFGLNINSYLADVESKRLVLDVLGIPLVDLDVIRGSNVAGASLNDWAGFSRLHDPIFRTADRYWEDSRAYDLTLLDKAGVDSILFGNLTINGSIDGSAIRYRYLDGTTLKIADISTSRVSSWSSSDSRASSPSLTEQAKARISYGARVGIKTSNTDAHDADTRSILEFGTQSGASGISGRPRLQTSLVAEEREFSAELPTSRITVDIDGTPIKLYAMKGIPLVFEGQFSRVRPTVYINRIGSIRPSWKVEDVDDPTIFVNFPDILSGTRSTIDFRGSSAKERYIKFYYNPDNIRNAYFDSCNLEFLPDAVLTNARYLRFRVNLFKNFPDFTAFAPNMKIFFMDRNLLQLSETPSERKLNAKILNKLPSDLQQCYIGSNYYGSISDDSTIPATDVSDMSWYTQSTVGTGNSNASLFYQRFGTNLTVLNITRYGSRQYNHPDNDDKECHIPNISDTCTTYTLYRGDFRGIAGGSGTGNSRIDGTPTDNGHTYLPAPTGTEKNIKTASGLVNLNIQRNWWLSDQDFRIDSPNIERVWMHYTNLPCPNNLAGRSKLRTFDASYTRNFGPLVDTSGNFLFDGCNALESITINHSSYPASTATDGAGTLIGMHPNGGLSGKLPKFNNTALKSVRFYSVRLEGGVYGDNSTDPTIPTSVFNDSNTAGAPNLERFELVGNYLRVSNIQIDAFQSTTKLKFLRIRSNKKINGVRPNLGGCSKLDYLDLQKNNLTGTMYDFVSNPLIRYVNVSVNRLSGTFPALENLSKLYLIRANMNDFTAIESFINLPKLQYLYIHQCSISGSIPNFNQVGELKTLTIYNNNLSSYPAGSLETNTKLSYFDVSGNNLTSGSLNNIINDMYTNYQSRPRGGVTVNIRANNGNLSQASEEKADFLKSKGWNVVWG
tara:strand:+ start:4632 stop:7340 length:2709 start_codon:yes stop_codon:yes gene_type:complete